MLLESEEPWQSACFLCFFKSFVHDTTWSSAAEHQQRDQHSTNDNTPHPTPPHAPPHPALSRSMIQRDHLQRSNNRCAVIGEPGSPRVYLYIRIHASLQKRILRTPGPCTFTYLKWYVYIHERARRYIFLYTHPCLLVQTCIWWLQRRRTWQIVNNIMFKQIQNRF